MVTKSIDNKMAIEGFLPIFSFTLVFVVLFAILNNTKILGGIAVVQAIVALVIGLIFASVSDFSGYIENITSIIAVFVVVLFFLILLVAVAINDPSKIIKPWVVWPFMIALVLLFIIYAYYDFNWANSSVFKAIKNFFFQPEIYRGFWLALVSVIVGAVLIKS